MIHEFQFPTEPGVTLAGAWCGHEDPLGVVQIVHGAKEHKERYYEFMGWVEGLGCASVIADSRGHGASVSERYPLGYMDGWKPLVSDQAALTEYIHDRWPRKPVCMFGHSFGSLIARCYLEKHDYMINKMILSGTVGYRMESRIAIALAEIIMLFSGKHGRNPLLIALGDNDKVDWVSHDPDVMARYRADPLCCGYKYTNNAIATIWKADRELAKSRHFSCQHPDIPILSISGAEDPVTRGERGLERSETLLRVAGYKDMRFVTFPNMRHEIINCRNRELVMAEIEGFLMS